MKKLALLMSFLTLASNAFSFSILHEHKIESSSNNKTPVITENVDFSGTWAGECDGVDFQLMLKQNEEQVALTVIYL